MYACIMHMRLCAPHHSSHRRLAVPLLALTGAACATSTEGPTATPAATAPGTDITTAVAAAAAAAITDAVALACIAASVSVVAIFAREPLALVEEEDNGASAPVKSINGGDTSTGFRGGMASGGRKSGARVSLTSAVDAINGAEAMS